MEAGPLNNIRVGYIIQARVKSTRLPGKILLPLPFNKGIPLLKWITDTLSKSRFDKKLIVASSSNLENDILEQFCVNENLEIFRGDENDVLSRFISIIKKHSFDVIVRITADNPFLDLVLLEKVIKQHIAQNKDYTKTEGLPLGMNFEIVNPKALLQLEAEQLTSEEREHVTLSLRNNSDCQLLLNVGDEAFKSLRLTVDYPSDYAVASLVSSALLEESDWVSFENIKKIAITHPWIFEINQSNFQKKQYISEQDEREDAIAFLKKYDFNWSAQRLMKVNSVD